MSSTGGYDDGYAACPCFWGRKPGSLLVELVRIQPDVTNMRVLDAGCGEGKNAAFLAARGARVTAIDISPLAIRNARSAWTGLNIEWKVGDIRQIELEAESFDLVIAYGLLHCLKSPDDIGATVHSLKRCTRTAGYHVACAFNSRKQDLRAHPGFQPCLISDAELVAYYKDWQLITHSDSDLHETHPHNNIPHVHSLTRFIAKKIHG